MNFTMEYYLSKYEELSVLSDTKKCRTSLMRNKDTGELVVKKEMGKESFSVYSLLKSIKNKNLIKVLECFRDEDKTIEIEEYVNGKRLDDYFREKKATLEQVVDVGIALCEGLAPMNKLNLVHRDIQPKNIIITMCDNYTLTDSENKGRQGLKNIGTFNGYYITNGKAIKIKCIKEARNIQTKYEDLEGNEIKVNDGNTWINICPTDAKVEITGTSSTTSNTNSNM